MDASQNKMKKPKIAQFNSGLCPALNSHVVILRITIWYACFQGPGDIVTMFAHYLFLKLINFVYSQPSDLLTKLTLKDFIKKFVNQKVSTIKKCKKKMQQKKV